MVRGQWFGSSVDSLACITSMCSVQRFPGGHSLCLASGSFFYPIPPPQGIANFIDEWHGVTVTSASQILESILA